MTKLSLGQAAKHAKRSKGTISKALNNGNLTGNRATKNGRMTWEIDPSELQRWMEANPLREPQEVQSTTPAGNVENTSENSALEVEVKALREKLQMVEELRDRERDKLVDEIEDLRRSRDEERAERRQLTAQLTDQRQQPKRKGFFGRLFG